MSVSEITLSIDPSSPCPAIYYYDGGGWSICILPLNHLEGHQRFKHALYTKEFPGRWIDRTVNGAEDRAFARLQNELREWAKQKWCNPIDIEAIIQIVGKYFQ